MAIVCSYFLNARWTWPERRSDQLAKQFVAFILVSAIGVGIAELCLFASHYGLGLTSRLEDNASANLVGLALGLLWRFYAYDRWVFRPGTAPASEALGAELPLLLGLTAPVHRLSSDLDTSSAH